MNEHKFDAKGTIYAHARPRYPEDLFRHLIHSGILKPSVIAADIGSGTGIFTTALAAFVQTVFAVEPNADMRSTAQTTFANIPNIISVNATAEHTSLCDRSVDAIFVAQAFHWFDRSAFKAECKRILKADGKVVLLWNDRDHTADIIKKNYEVNKQFCPHFKGASNGIDFSQNAFDDFFEGSYDTITFDNHVTYDPEAFLARNLSSSYAPKQQDAVYQEYIEALTRVFHKYCRSGTVAYPYITRCYIGSVI